jgi:hypothetical protein
MITLQPLTLEQVVTWIQAGKPFRWLTVQESNGDVCDIAVDIAVDIAGRTRGDVTERTEGTHAAI